MPFDDWQFYVVSLVALWGLWAMTRPFLPRKGKRAGHAGCGSGGGGKRKRSQLTIFGKKL